MTLRLYSFLLLAATAACAGNLVSTMCMSEQEEVGRDTFLKQMVFRLPGATKENTEMISCTYSLINQETATFNVVALVNGVECSAVFRMLILGGGYVVSNEESLIRTAKLCEKKMSQAKTLKPEEIKLKEEQKIKEMAKLPEPLPLKMVFDEELLKKDFMKAYVQLIQTPDQLKKEEEAIKEAEDRTAEAMGELAQTHGLLKRQNTPSDLFKRLADKGDVPRKMIMREKVPMFVGGWVDCDEDQKARYLGDLLAHLALAGDFLTVPQIRKCTVQLVAGLNVKLTVGADAEHECHTHIFYPLMGGEPEFLVKKGLCLPPKRRDSPLIGAPSKPQPCQRFTMLKALAAFRRQVTHPDLKFAYEENVTECTEQFADGTKVHLKFSFNEKPCEYFMFFSPTGEVASNQAILCSP